MHFNQRNTKLKRHLIAFIFIIVIGAIFLLPNLVFAQDADVWGGGTPGINEEVLREEAGLASTDPRIVIARVIRAVLGFLGIIAVGLIIYGGWIYMTSEGNEEKIERAKNILKNAVIGLIIILSAFGIVSFILGRLLDRQIGTRVPGEGGIGGLGGFGAIGSCSVESVYPEDFQKEVARNSSIIATFKEDIASSTICDANQAITANACQLDINNVRIFPINRRNECTDTSTSSCVTATVYTNDSRTFVFKPNEYLGSASEYMWYGVEMTNDISFADRNEGVFTYCRSNLAWQFEVSNILDLTPPQVESVFPAPDTGADTAEPTENAVNATGTISVISQPKAEVESSVADPVKDDPSMKTASFVDSSDVYTGSEDGLISVQILQDQASFNATSSTVKCTSGIQSISGNILNIGCGLRLEIEDNEFITGNRWTFNATTSKSADTLTVAGETYVFVNEVNGIREILVGATKEETADNIVYTLNERFDIIVSTSTNTLINVSAYTAGSGGNSIKLSFSSSQASNALEISANALAGGKDKVEKITTKGRKDQPKNVIIQVNFDEPMMPVTISGDAGSVSQFIRVVNATTSAKSAGVACSVDSDCKSYKCEGNPKKCVGNYIAGQFDVSNLYKTVEFTPDVYCGSNNCGGRKYCLPGDANIKVELDAALLETCADNNDCTSFSPYNTCDTTKNICRDCDLTGCTADDKNYPTGQALSGVADACFNSLDGDRNENAEGPATYFSDNKLFGNCDSGDTICTESFPEGFVYKEMTCSGVCDAKVISTLQSSLGDSYSWDFYTTDDMDNTPPEMTESTPGKDDSNVNLSNDVNMGFSKVLRSSTLKTGFSQIYDELNEEFVTHRHVNIWNYTDSPLGYWITKEDVDDPADNELDYTHVLINHSMFDDAQVYRAQIGSGIEDVYQNCYLPSKGPACLDVDKINNPSCCNGATTTVLTQDGSCP